MPSQKNKNQVKILTEKLEKAKSLVLADYRGLTVEKQQELRESLKEVGGELSVVKNRLLQIALKKTNFSLPKDQSPLTGPTILLLSFEDEIAPLKVLYNFTQDNEIPKIKFGFLDHNFLEQERVETFAQLPAREELQAKLVGLLSSPLRGTVYVLKGNLNKLVMILEELKKKKS